MKRADEMQNNALYREAVPFRFMNFFAAFLGLIAAGMLGLLVYHYTVAPIDNEPQLGFLFAAEFVIMSGLAIFISNFRMLEIFLTYDALIIRFGRIRKPVAWSEIESFRVVETGNLLNSGGWKLNLGKSGWSNQFTVIGKPRVILRLRTGRIREIVFSTGKPREVIQVMQSRLGKNAYRQQP